MAKTKTAGIWLLLVGLPILVMLSIACTGATDTAPASATGQTAADHRQAEVSIPSTPDRVGAEEPGASTISTSEISGSKELPPLQVRLSVEGNLLDGDIPLVMGFILKDEAYRATTLIESSGIASLTETTNLEWDNPPANEELITQTAFRIEGLGEGLIKAEVLVFAESGEILYGRSACYSVAQRGIGTEALEAAMGWGAVETSQTQGGEPQPDASKVLTHTVVEGVGVEGKPSTTESSKELPPLEVRLSFEGKQLPVGRDIPLEMGFIFKDDVYRATTLIEASGAVSLTETTNLELDNPPANEEVITQTAFRIEGLGEGLIKAWVLVFAESGEMLYGRSAWIYFLVGKGEVLTGTISPDTLKLQYLERALKSGTISRWHYNKARKEVLGGGAMTTSGSVSKCP